MHGVGRSRLTRARGGKRTANVTPPTNGEAEGTNLETGEAFRSGGKKKRGSDRG